MRIYDRRTPDAQPWMFRTAEIQRDPRVIYLIPAGDRQALSWLTKAGENVTKVIPPGWLAEAFSLTQTLQSQD